MTLIADFYTLGATQNNETQWHILPNSNVLIEKHPVLKRKEVYNKNPQNKKSKTWHLKFKCPNKTLFKSKWVLRDTKKQKFTTRVPVKNLPHRNHQKQNELFNVPPLVRTKCLNDMPEY